jgi:hypothetical protein
MIPGLAGALWLGVRVYQVQRCNPVCRRSADGTVVRPEGCVMNANMLRRVAVGLGVVLLTFAFYQLGARAAVGDCDQKCRQTQIIGRDVGGGTIICLFYDKDDCFYCDGSATSAWCLTTTQPGAGTCGSMGNMMSRADSCTLKCTDDTAATNRQEGTGSVDNYNLTVIRYVCSTGSGM